MANIERPFQCLRMLHCKSRNYDRRRWDVRSQSVKGKLEPEAGDVQHSQQLQSLGFFDEEFYTSLHDKDGKELTAVDADEGLIPAASNVSHSEFGEAEEASSPGFIDSAYFDQKCFQRVTEQNSEEATIDIGHSPHQQQQRQFDDLGYIDKALLGVTDTTGDHIAVDVSINQDSITPHLTEPKPLVSSHNQLAGSPEELNYFDQALIGSHHTDIIPSRNNNSEPMDATESGVADDQKENTIGEKTDSPTDNPKSQPRVDWKRSVWHSFGRRIPDIDSEPAYSIIDLILKNIIYEDDNLVCINKPYKLACQGGSGVHHSISKYSEQIADKLGSTDRLILCHTVGRSSTGALLLAKNTEAAATIKAMFEENLVEKQYLAVTKGVPSLHEGCIDVPICTQSQHGTIYRSTLVPPTTNTNKKFVFPAQTRYKVIRSGSGAALVELNPVTDWRHQVRVHLAGVLNTPILGDHKYSHSNRLAPQKLPSDILTKFKIPQSKARHIPMHLHIKKLVIPKYFNSKQSLVVSARMPAFFSHTIRVLKLCKF